MSSSEAYTNVTVDEVVQTGKERVLYGDWLWPMIKANGRSESSSETPVDTLSISALPRKGRRGRPRVTEQRDESAIEKRRAQVREAQRTYQKRKDSATATEKRRVDELLQVLSDLSTDVEALLQSASKAGNMHRDDDVSKHIQRLWSTYNTIINNDCVVPELRLQQVKNGKRLAEHQTRSNFRVSTTPSVPQHEGDVEATVPRRNKPIPFDPSDISFELVHFEDTAVMESFQHSSSVNAYNGHMAGRSIFDICAERQAAMKLSDCRRAKFEAVRGMRFKSP